MNQEFYHSNNEVINRILRDLSKQGSKNQNTKSAIFQSKKNNLLIENNQPIINKQSQKNLMDQMYTNKSVDLNRHIKEQDDLDSKKLCNIKNKKQTENISKTVQIAMGRKNIEIMRSQQKKIIRDQQQNILVKSSIKYNDNENKVEEKNKVKTDKDLNVVIQLQKMRAQLLSKQKIISNLTCEQKLYKMRHNEQLNSIKMKYNIQLNQKQVQIRNKNKKINELNCINNKLMNDLIMYSKEKNLIKLQLQKQHQLILNYQNKNQEYLSEIKNLKNLFKHNDKQIVNHHKFEQLSNQIKSLKNQLQQKQMECANINNDSNSYNHKQQILEYQIQQLNKEIIQLKKENFALKFEKQRLEDKKRKKQNDNQVIQLSTCKTIQKNKLYISGQQPKILRNLQKIHNNI